MKLNLWFLKKALTYPNCQNRLNETIDSTLDCRLTRLSWKNWRLRSKTKTGQSLKTILVKESFKVQSHQWNSRTRSIHQWKAMKMSIDISHLSIMPSQNFLNKSKRKKSRWCTWTQQVKRINWALMNHLLAGCPKVASQCSNLLPLQKSRRKE